MKFKTDYSSAGTYTYPVRLSDASGNISLDTIKIEVLDKNRPPILNPEYEEIWLNIAEGSKAYTIDPQELFINPDGDTIQLLAGNYHPDVVDLALGYKYVDLHLLKEGFAYLIFGADDGKENGFVVYDVYVYVVNDPGAVEASTDAFGQKAEILLESGKLMTFYPNPVADSQSHIIFKLMENSELVFDVYDTNGRLKMSKKLDQRSEGIYNETFDISFLTPGLYMCRYMVNGVFQETTKIVVK